MSNQRALCNIETIVLCKGLYDDLCVYLRYGECHEMQFDKIIDMCDQVAMQVLSNGNHIF